MGEEQEASIYVENDFVQNVVRPAIRLQFLGWRLSTAPSRGSRICNRPEKVSMIRGIAIAGICIGALAALDHQLYYGQYTDKVLQMLAQMRHSFGI